MVHTGLLGPLLFILYINDIANCSEVLRFILFADDTNRFHSDRVTDRDEGNLINAVNIELQYLSDWFRANKLSLNIKKTKFILFGSKH